MVHRGYTREQEGAQEGARMCEEGAKDARRGCKACERVQGCMKGVWNMQGLNLGQVKARNWPCQP